MTYPPQNMTYQEGMIPDQVPSNPMQGYSIGVDNAIPDYPHDTSNKDLEQSYPSNPQGQSMQQYHEEIEPNESMEMAMQKEPMPALTHSMSAPGGSSH